MLAKCRAHLAEARESYFQHLCFAAGVGLMLVAAGLACIIHAIVPGCCTRTASATVQHLGQLFRDRDTLNAAMVETSGALTLVGLIAVALPPLGIILAGPMHPAWAAATAMLAFSIPAAYLWTNPQLDPVQ